MTHPAWNRRLLGTTRGRIIALLRRGSLTVEDLARSLDLTGNAVRAQLAALERDGLVRQRGTVKGARKPSVTYAVAPEAERALSRAYLPLLEALVDALADRLDPAELRQLLRATGRRLARSLPPLRGTAAARVAAAGRLLDDLGGLTHVEAAPRGWVIASDGCPVGALVCRRAEVCRAVEAMVAELLELPVREACDRSGERPRCRFEIGGAATRRRSGKSPAGSGGSPA